MRTRKKGHASPRAGFAMVIVILVLMALLVLCTPFLLTVRNADKASMENANRMAGGIALDSSARHVRASLGRSHPALDGTPYFDSLDELEVTNHFADGFLDASDPNGVMWDVDVNDVSGRIDLNSAPPQVIGNLLGGSSRLAGGVEAEETEIALVSVAGFLPAGFVLVDGELFGYTGVDGNKLTGALRGLGVELDDEGNPLPCGLRPPSGHASSRLAIDQRAWALCNWRVFTPDGELKAFDSIEQVREAQGLVMAGTLGPEAFEKLQRSATVYSGVQGGAVWQRPTRLVTGVVGGTSNTIQVADARWFNAGTTIQVTDGLTTELALVRVTNGNTLTLLDCLVNDYEGYAAVVRPLARRPVNVNTAPREVLEALFLNLQLKRRQAMITAYEARLLAEVVIQSRPFDGFEDFVRRLILPAGFARPLPPDAPVIPEVFAVDEDLVDAGQAGFAPIIDEDDARALYKNALNANDGELEWSTMPLAFVSTDVHRMELRTSVNALSGVERVSAVREQVELIVPQRDLMHVWTRQEDFDGSFRLDRDARGWMSGPNATTRYDPIFKSDPPTRSRPNLGAQDTMPTFDPLVDQAVYTFAAREDEGWIQLAPSRVEEVGPLVGRMEHFDHESRDPEGRYLPDGTVRRNTDHKLVGWSSGDLLRPLWFSGWLQPRALEDGAYFLDVGGSYVDADRISLLIDGGDLVLRVLDGAGDHPETGFEEVAEVRYTLATGAGPGFPVDTWTHFGLDVRGNRPDQMTLLSDGRWHTRTKGLTYLTGSIDSETGSIPVESTQGFPSPCVLRIGDELIEATVAGGTSFEALFQESGAQAGYGGRGARVEFEDVEIGLPVNLATASGFHASGTPVMLYGYSLPLASNVPPGETRLSSELGIFAVGRVVGTADGQEQIVITLDDGTAFDLGTGLDLATPVTLELAPADPNMDIGTVMSAFSRTGGYAALMTWNYNLRITNDAGITEPITTINGTRLGGVEIVHYSSSDGTQIVIDRRGDNVGELANLAGADPDVKGKGAFVFDWNDNIVTASTFEPLDEHLLWHTKIIPISLPVASTDAFKDNPLGVGSSQFAQVTHVSDAELNEWVRYDEVTQDQLVRDDPFWLREAQNAVQSGQIESDTGEGSAGPTGPGPEGGGSFVAPPDPGGPPPPSSGGGPALGSRWQYDMGVAEDEDYPLTLSVRSAFQFRGVLGTYPHAHGNGTAVLPVWKTYDLGPSGGWPGRFDAISLVDLEPDDPGFPGTVNHAHRPNQYTRYSWEPTAGDGMTPTASGEAALAQSGFETNRCYVALQAASPVPVAPDLQLGPEILDSRLRSRVVKFPSGELPRIAQVVAVGGSYQGGGVPSALVDELAFGNDDFGAAAGFGEATWGAQLVVSSPISEGEEDGIRVYPRTIRTALSNLSFTVEFLAGLPEDAGLLRIGEEILCYDSRDPDTGVLTIAPGGRGLLGTEPQAHSIGEGVTFLAHIPVSVLAGNIAGSDSQVPLASLEGFPSEGTALVGDELFHFAWQRSSALEMPRASEEPGAMDAKGGGIFRGRFGTGAQGHEAGAPVILVPFRYWDRWADGADAPEMHYLGLSIDQPNAFWRSVFWDIEEAGFDGPRLGVMQRTEPTTPWDADPGVDEDLEQMWDGVRDGQGNPIGEQSHRIEWRVFVRYEPGSYDALDGLAHGWKTTPRLRFFGAEYLGPGMVLKRVNR